jgi:glycosyltransferase involved in cell wall biosynthesis
VNVLQLISSSGYYGAENVIVSLSEALERHNCRSVVGVFHQPSQQNEELIRQAERRGLTVRRIACRGRWDFGAVRAIRDEVERLKIDLIHTHGYKPDIYGLLASRGSGVKRLSTCHLWTHNTIAVRFYEVLDSFFLRGFDAVVGVSEAIADSLRRSGIPRSKIRVIDNGIDVARFVQARPTLAEQINKGQALAVGTVGRLVPQKGLEYYLQAAREVLQVLPNVTFIIVGDGPDREKLENMAGALGIQRNVIFAGQCSDMPGAYASMDVFVLASVDEGMPMVLLEALASKRAVVATQVGAVPRLIIPEQTGLLVAPRDVQALKQAMLALLNDPALRSRLGNAGEALVKRSYSRDLMAENYLHLYRQIVSPGSVLAEQVEKRSPEMAWTTSSESPAVSFRAIKDTLRETKTAKETAQ